MGKQACVSCGGELAPGAKFCSICGADAAAGSGAAAPRSAGPSGKQYLPWIVASVLAVVAIAAVVYATGRVQPTAVAATASGAPGAGGAPDISAMTPREQFDRLINRITAAAESGDTAAVTRFWPMASGAYQNLPAADRDADARFHMAWLRMFAAQYPEATALADSIIAGAPNHLFAFYLRSNIAKARGDAAKERDAAKAFRANFDAEMARKDRPEYEQHRAMLERFRDAAAKP